MKLSVSDVSLVPSFVGGAFHTPTTIIIAYFYICNNNFHIAKLNFFDACCGQQNSRGAPRPEIELTTRKCRHLYLAQILGCEGNNLRPAMESQARNGNASQAQRASRDNPKKL
jgi:hypothetical protein